LAQRAASPLESTAERLPTRQQQHHPRLVPFTTTLLAVRNQRILEALNTRQQENARRAAAGLPRKPAGAAARPSPASPTAPP
jgi:hypothetical protein